MTNLYPHYALVVAGIIFGFVALMHLLRLIYKTPVIIAKKTIPLWVSGLGFIIPLLLSIWMFSASCSVISYPANDTAPLRAQI